MPIVSHIGPEDGEARISRAFSALTDGPADLFAPSQSKRTAAAFVRKPLPIYAVAIEQAALDPVGALRQASRTGWRYLIEHPDGCSLMDLPEGKGRLPTLLGGNQLAANLMRAGRLATRIVGEAHDLEPRLLDLNLIGDSVLWLHDKTNLGADRFISLRGCPRELKPAALFGRLRLGAVRKIQAIAAAGSEGGG